MTSMLPWVSSIDKTEWKGVTFLLSQTTIAKCLEKLRKRTFSAHELAALPSIIILVSLSMNKQVNKCKKMSSEIKKKPTTQISSDAINQSSLRNCTSS